MNEEFIEAIKMIGRTYCELYIQILEGIRDRELAKEEAEKITIALITSAQNQSWKMFWKGMDEE